MRLSIGLLCLLSPVFAGAQVWEKTIAPGLTYRMEVDSSAPRIIHALRFSPRGETRAETQLAGGTINEAGTVKGRLSPSTIREQSGAVACINGDFFSYEHGAPIGMMVRNGELITTPAKSRAAFGWGKDIAMGFATWEGHVTIGGKPLSIDAVNQPTGKNRLHLFSPAEGDLTVSADSTLVTLKVDAKSMPPSGLVQAEVQMISRGAQVAHVQDGQWMLVGRGTRADDLGSLKPGEKISVDWKVGGFDWSKISEATGGGPFLVQGGAVSIDAVQEGFGPDFIARNPRSAIGRTAGGDIWFVAIDGRQTVSIGATLDEEAKIMLSLGCVDAMNLDGGGSTLLNLLGVTLNRPIGSAAERPVATGILVFAKQPKPTVGTFSIVGPASVTIGEYPEIKLALDGKPLSQTDVIWGAQGAAWIDQGGGLHPITAGKVTITAYSGGQIVTLDITIKPKGLAVPGKGSDR